MQRPDLNDTEIADVLRRDVAAARIAFETLVRMYGERLVIFAYRLTGDQDLAQDIAQDVFVGVWERRELLAQASSIRAYLYGAVRNRVVDALRRERRAASWRIANTEAERESTDDPAQHVETVELQRAIEATLQSLPPRMHQIATLRWVDGLTPAEIARSLDISVSTVSNTLTQAAKTVRHLLVAHRTDRTG